MPVTDSLSMHAVENHHRHVLDQEEDEDDGNDSKRRKLSLGYDTADATGTSLVANPGQQERTTGMEDSAEPWTLERLMRRFQSSEEIQDYLDHSQDIELLRLLESLQEVRQARRKLPEVNDLKDVRRILKDARKILVLTGAGVSVSAGIPDFRSADGIYARLKREFMMPSPTCMFDINYFNENPGPFFNFASELWPGRFKPTRSHLFIAELERRGKLLRNYTQNIDTLEHQAGGCSYFIPKRMF
jgi:hypothetical protein